MALPRPGITGKPVRLAPRRVLAGREALLAELEARLSAGDGSASCIISLTGRGGAGKTSTAVEYAYRHLAEVAVAWQFPADDSTVLAAGFADLAAQLGVQVRADTKDLVASVHTVLAGFAAPWLLIFDDAAGMGSVAEFLPKAGPGRVLITSQNPSWPCPALHVPELAPDDAAGFLVSRTRDPDRQAAQDLAVMLDGLPLALEQAAAYVEARGETLARYLAEFRRQPAGLLARGEPGGYGKTVASTWALAFDHLQRDEPGAISLLRLLAFCAPDAIPLRLLLQIPRRPANQFRPRAARAHRTGHWHTSRRVARALTPLIRDPLRAGDAIKALHEYSLVTPAGDGTVSVHRLVQLVTRDQMPARLQGQWQQAAAALVEAALPRDPAQPGTWPAFAALLPHAEAALAKHSDGLQQVASYLEESGNYRAARDLQRQVAEARERAFGPDHALTLNSRAWLAWRTADAGDPAAARDQLTALLPVLERVRGPEHPATVSARISLATWTGAKDAAAARDQLAALLPALERVYGPDHLATLEARQDLADWTGTAGDAAAARDQLGVLLPVFNRVYGPDHPSTLEIRGDLADWTGKGGDAAAARDQFTALASACGHLAGPEHPFTLEARDVLADWTGEGGDPAAARDQLAALLPALERVLGPGHPKTLAARDHLARWTRKALNGTAPGAE